MVGTHTNTGKKDDKGRTIWRGPRGGEYVKIGDKRAKPSVGRKSKSRASRSKSPARSPTRKSPARKSPTRKSPTRKLPARKSPARSRSPKRKYASAPGRLETKPYSPASARKTSPRVEAFIRTIFKLLKTPGATYFAEISDGLMGGLIISYHKDITLYFKESWDEEWEYTIKSTPKRDRITGIESDVRTNDPYDKPHPKDAEIMAFLHEVKDAYNARKFSSAEKAILEKYARP